MAVHLALAMMRLFSAWTLSSSTSLLGSLSLSPFCSQFAALPVYSADFWPVSLGDSAVKPVTPPVRPFFGLSPPNALVSRYTSFRPLTLSFSSSLLSLAV